jgi:hypothetical protein
MAIVGIGGKKRGRETGKGWKARGEEGTREDK